MREREIRRIERNSDRKIEKVGLVGNAERETETKKGKRVTDVSRQNLSLFEERDKKQTD